MTALADRVPGDWEDSEPATLKRGHTGFNEACFAARDSSQRSSSPTRTFSAWLPVPFPS